MKRQIKFRGKDRMTDKWVYGDLLAPITGCRIVNYTEEDNGSMKRADYHYHDVLDDTVGQFTGLLDRNGKEIYEGDIIEIGFNEDNVTTKYKCVVRWNDLNAGFVLYPQEQSEGPWHGWLMNNCIIIGNIHEQSKS